VNVNEKKSRGRFLTAKYPKHQMGLIRRRLNVEDWIDEQLKILFDVVRHSAAFYASTLRRQRRASPGFSSWVGDFILRQIDMNSHFSAVFLSLGIDVAPNLESGSGGGSPIGIQG